MRKLILKAFLLAAINAVAGFLFAGFLDAQHQYAPWETDSLLEVLPTNETVDAVFLGSSRAYMMSRLRDNHEALEQELGLHVLNLALPTGGGIRPARLFFEQFLAQGDHARKLVVFVSPFVYFDSGPNDGHKFVYYEPLRCSFLTRLLLDGYPPRRIFTYIHSKFSWDYITQHPEPLIRQTREVAAIDPERVAMRVHTLYLQGLQQDAFQRYTPELRRLLEIAQKNGCEIHLVIAPTLLGPEPGAAQIKEYIASLHKDFAFRFDDFSGAMTDPALFADLDHLNTAGVAYFARHFLKPALESAP